MLKFTQRMLAYQSINWWVDDQTIDIEHLDVDEGAAVGQRLLGERTAALNKLVRMIMLHAPLTLTKYFWSD